MMVSLRVRFILALLVSSIAAIVVFGLVARWMLMRQFSELLWENAFSRFQVSVTSYIEDYGSLEKALAAEPFGAYVRRERELGRGPGVFPPPEHPGPGFGAGLRMPPPPGHPFPGMPPPGMPPPHGGPGGGGPSDGGPPRGIPSGGPLGVRVHPGGPPPFLFLLLDPQGVVRMGDDTYRVGQHAPAELRAQAQPIVVDGKVAALAVPRTEPHLTPIDQAYLSAINHALVYAVGAGVLLAVGLGLLFGSRLSRDLRHLTGAMHAVGEGRLLQHVRVRSRDEIGILAQAFNRMSAELARTHENLRQSEEQIRSQAERLQELSIRDGLTGLFNRRYFDDHAAVLFAQAVRYTQPLTLVICDLDHFKRINDRHSHAVGDEVLRRVAGLIQANVRTTDLVARYGGEEFVIGFSNTPAREALGVCEKLRGLIEVHPWHELAPDLRVTISMGVNDETALGSFERMVAAADAQLYRAKAEGRNRICAGSLTAPGAV